MRPWVPPGQEKNYDAEGRWIGAGREPFELWWQRTQKYSKQLGLTDQDDQQGMEYALEVPGLEDVIHIIPRAKVTKEEMAARNRALKQGLPSPLTAAQEQTIKWKRDTFLRIMKSPTPPDVREAGYWVNQIENVGDMMTAAYWGGKGIFYLLQKLKLTKRSPASKYVGWAMVAKDITDVVNMFKIARTARADKKGAALKGSNLNPFSKESKLSRGIKLKTKMPGFPDWVEIAQVTDQFFGVGISFGAVVGFVNDTLWAVKRGRNIVVPGTSQKEPDQVAAEAFAAGTALQQMGP